MIQCSRRSRQVCLWHGCDKWMRALICPRLGSTMAAEVLAGLCAFRQMLKYRLFIAVPIALAGVVGIFFGFGAITAIESAAGFLIVAWVFWELDCRLGLRKLRQKTGLVHGVLRYMLPRVLTDSNWCVPSLGNPTGKHEAPS